MSKLIEAALMQKRNKSKVMFHVMFWAMAGLLFIMIIVSLSVGQYKIPFGTVVKILFSRVFRYAQTWTRIEEAVFFNLRMPRTFAAVIIGAALALAGAAYQSLFKNPMVSPDILGVSAGASVGAAICILISGGSALVQFGAFAGGIAAVVLTMLIPKLIRNNSTMVLVLAGIIVGSLMTSVINIIKFVADTDSKLAEITYWTMGSFANLTMKDIYYVLPALVLPMIIILLTRYRLNVMSLGEVEAKALGLNVKRTRGIIILSSTLLTAASVCVAGTIGWVGLVIPHLSRMIIGADNKKMLPIAVLLGAVFMLFIDILCRTITTAELRISILTGIIGAPFYIFILFKQRNGLR
jgi:iron complex transport system permease protein